MEIGSSEFLLSTRRAVHQQAILRQCRFSLAAKEEGFCAEGATAERPKQQSRKRERKREREKERERQRRRRRVQSVMPNCDWSNAVARSGCRTCGRVSATHLRTARCVALRVCEFGN